jgi:DNA polymerase III delta prime subunit
MNSITLHPEIKEKLNFFIETGKIPNIIFHGASGSGKRTIVHNFITDIYQNNKELIKNYVMYVNCAHGKGIKFVRDELKFFAKTHINVKGAGNFKTIVLSNADELTIDAQSALRRCIELFSHTTRFFIIVQDKYKLLKPILSRLCEIFVYDPVINAKKTNLHKHNIQLTFNESDANEKKMFKWFDKIFHPLQTINDVMPSAENVVGASAEGPANVSSAAGPAGPAGDYQELMELANILYEKGYSGLDLMKYIEQVKNIEEMKKYQMLLVFNKVKKEFRNEKLFILFILNFMLLRSEYDLENISFM